MSASHLNLKHIHMRPDPDPSLQGNGITLRRGKHRGFEIAAAY
jgi:hypothetical protein